MAVLVSGMRIGGIYENISRNDRLNHPDRLHLLKIKNLRLATEGFTYEQLRDFKLAVPDYTDVYRMMIYAEQVNTRSGKSEQYPCYSTPEAYSLINQMLAQRQREGELDEIDKELRDKPFNLSYFPPDTPVFRNEYGALASRHQASRAKKAEIEQRRIKNLRNPQPLTFNGMKDYFGQRRIKFLGHVVKKGVRGTEAATKIKLFHGIRSFTHTQMDMEAHVEKNVIEWLEGRDLKGAAKHYDKWPEWKRLTEFWKAVPFLTIDKTKYLQEMIVQKDKKIDDMEMEKMRRKQMEWAMALKTDEVMREQQTTKDLLRAIESVMTVEQRNQIERLMSNSSLLSESKRLLLDVTKEADEAATIKDEK